MFKPRASQAEVLRYRRGRMAVLAVPGSGKTQTLSALAAALIDRGELGDDQEVLVVTLVNSAANNFSTRVRGLIQRSLPGLGYRVRTLHGLAHDIVRERPGLVGLDPDFQIMDERGANDLLSDAADTWVRTHLDRAQEYFNPELSSEKYSKVLRKDWPELVTSAATAFIRQAKDLQIHPGQIRSLLNERRGDFPLLEMGQEIYASYQRALAYRGAVDFNDLIRLALQALRLDPEYLDRLRRRWPYILEDEAQDSSQLQEEILRMLSGDHGNWIRVGDPNQAVYETFTTASPRFLRSFSEEEGVAALTLPESGRSAVPIIDLANALVDWCRQDHPLEDAREALDLPYIRPTDPMDPRPNPPASECLISLFDKRQEPAEEIDLIVRSLQKWLPKNPERTVAVLVLRNARGTEFAQRLRQRGVPYIEMLSSLQSTRDTAEVLSAILRYLGDAVNPRLLADAYRKVGQRFTLKEDLQTIVLPCERLLARCGTIESYVHPNGLADWLDKLADTVEPPVLTEMGNFRGRLQTWLAACDLPIDQLILTIAQDLFSEALDLALADKLAGLLKRLGRDHPDWVLSDYAGELSRIARNERKFLGLENDLGFDPDQHPGKVVIATLHKAKGLEWDRVYLTSVNNYDFPSGQTNDTYQSESWFLRGRLNLEAEVLHQLRCLAAGDVEGLFLPEGEAGYAARADYISERLRLLYVGITRARRELILTTNSGRFGNCVPAVPFIALSELEKSRNANYEPVPAG